MVWAALVVMVQAMAIKYETLLRVVHELVWAANTNVSVVGRVAHCSATGLVRPMTEG